MSITQQSENATLFADRVANCCYAKYASLPKTGKPSSREWTPLAGVVKVEHHDESFEDALSVEVVALGTGSKCLGRTKLSPRGDVVNDSHAEVMARRGFLRYLYREIHAMHSTGRSEIFDRVIRGRCRLKSFVTFHFFASHTPCGDASIFPKSDVGSEGFGECLEVVRGCVETDRQSELVSVGTKTNVTNSLQPSKIVQDKFSNIRQTYDKDSKETCAAICKKRKLSHETIEGNKCPDLSINTSIEYEEGISPQTVGNSDLRGVTMLKPGSQNFLGESNVTRGERTNTDTYKNINVSRNSSNDGDVCRASPRKDIFRTGAKCLPTEPRQDPKLPGVQYHTVAALRTKPGRGDPTLSLSCSDKLARWNAVGIQGALLSLLLSAPVHLGSIVIARVCPHSQEALHRAVVGRVDGGSRPLLLHSLVPFVDARRGDRQPCAASIVWCKVSHRSVEVAVEGRKQGVTKKAAHTTAGRLLVCKKELLRQFVSTASLAPCMEHLADTLGGELANRPYLELKSCAQEYQLSWKQVRGAHMHAWADKPLGLLQFTALD
uniref:tRNA-specific adenosine deaminase 1 n=1 Tax=Timema californicum TaxID=61474 RepID=A0A7R9JFE9_TIMCA|nr:unnamed protein product [Timema californicum]